MIFKGYSSKVKNLSSLETGLLRIRMIGLDTSFQIKYIR